MKKSKKKLPGFWLGTRRPTSLGYLPNYGIGNAQFTSIQGEDIDSETKALRSSAIPSSISRFSQYAYPALNLLNTSTATAARTGLRTMGLSSGFQFTPDVLPTSVPQSASSTSSVGGAASGSTGTGGLLGTAGTVAGALASAYGTYDWINQLAHAGDHRSAGDMMNTRSINTYTTSEGNLYTQYGGINTSAERDYESANRRAKEFNFGATTTGTGFAAGATIGSLAGGWGGPIGAGIGAGVGALLGGLGSWLGWFDNEDEINRQIKLGNDVTSRENRQFRSDAETLDVKNTFSNRPKLSGKINAADGKQPVYSPFGKVNKKATARVSNGELIGNFEDGYVSRVPGLKNNKDTKLAALKDSDFVISNKYGLSDYAAATGDYAGALNIQDMLMNRDDLKYMMNGRETDLLFRAKNGKLPKFGSGTPWLDYGLATLPAFSSFITNFNLYNKDRYASTNIPRKQFENPMGSAAVNQIMSDMIDVRPYLAASNNAYRLSAWNVRNNPGMGLGGRMIALDSLARAKQAQDAEMLLKIDEANRAQRNTGAQMKYNLSTDLLNKQATEWQRWLALVQLANAAKDLALRQDMKNMNNAVAGGARNALQTKQYEDALGIKNRTLDIYQLSVNQNYLNLLYNMGRLGNNSKVTTVPTINSGFDWTNPALTKPILTTKYMPLWKQQLMYNTPSYKLSTPDLLNLISFKR